MIAQLKLKIVYIYKFILNPDRETYKIYVIFDTLCVCYVFSANILLDKHFEAKVADFGLAKQVNGGQYTKFTHVSQRNEKVYGSMDYLPDEYLEDLSKLRKEVDMFSFGIVCLLNFIFYTSTS